MQTDEFEALIAADERHWWYRGRRRIIHAVIGRLEVPAGSAVLDAGCGTGRTMDDLARYGPVAGFDLNPRGVEKAHERGHGDVEVARVEEIPHPDEAFGLITCLDVLEHTPDDVRSLEELRRVCRRGGVLIVTVPAYQLLWSTHDVANRHYRRYRRRQLLEAGRAAGWAPLSASYFNSILLAPGAVYRLAERLRRPERRRRRPHTELTPASLDGVLELPMRVEAALIRRGLRLPAGMSLIAAFRRAREEPATRRAPAPDTEAAPLAAAGGSGGASP